MKMINRQRLWRLWVIPGLLLAVLALMILVPAEVQAQTPERYYGGSGDGFILLTSAEMGLDDSARSITNAPGSYGFGILKPGSMASTTLNYFTVTNTSATAAVTITIGGSDMIGGNYTWTLSDTAAPGADIYGLKASLEGGSFNIVVKRIASFNTLVATLAASATQSWGLQIWAPTSFSVQETTQKSTAVTLTATAP